MSFKIGPAVSEKISTKGQKSGTHVYMFIIWSKTIGNDFKRRENVRLVNMNFWQKQRFISGS